MSDKILGIDLGTTRTAISHMIMDDVEIIENAEGEPVTPSVVMLEEDGNVRVGRFADNANDPERTIREIKRLIGTDETVTVDGEEYTPEQISAIILEKVVEDAEERLGQEINNVVITVPAYFGERERSATQMAGDIAGLEVERLLPEPSAACLTYGLEQGKLGSQTQELVFVYDLGGGTFDATLVDVDFGVNHIETLHSDGVLDLGGKDWTDRVIDWMLEQIPTESREEVDGNVKLEARLHEAAVEAKHTMMASESVAVEVPFLLSDYNFEETLTRTEFQKMTRDLLEQTNEPITDIFERSDYDIEDVDKVLLIGGATRMPQVETFVEDIFGLSPSKEINPDQAVANGAAIKAEHIASDGLSQSILPGGESDLAIIEVVPKSLGVRLHDGSTSFIIESDEPVPAQERRESFRTVRENQRRVNIPIVEGESIQADENRSIGEVQLGPIPPRSPSEDSLAVEFTISVDGTLEVEAEDLISGEKIDATFNNELTYSEGEIDEMREDLPTA